EVGIPPVDHFWVRPAEVVDGKAHDPPTLRTADIEVQLIGGPDFLLTLPYVIASLAVDLQCRCPKGRICKATKRQHNRHKSCEHRLPSPKIVDYARSQLLGLSKAAENQSTSNVPNTVRYSR